MIWKSVQGWASYSEFIDYHSDSSSEPAVGWAIGPEEVSFHELFENN